MSTLFGLTSGASGALAFLLAAGGNGWFLDFLGRFHPASVHFPIALLLAAAVAEAWRAWKKRPAAGGAAWACLCAGAALAVFSGTLGWLNSETQDFDKAGAGWLVLHRGFAIATIGLAFTALGFGLWARGTGERRWVLLFRASLFLSAFAVAGASHLGGVLVHGESYYTSVLPGGGGGLPPPGLPPEGAPVDFARDIAPILKSSCIKCHGPEKAKGELRLDTRKFAMEGGEDGPVIVPGDPEKSPIYKNLRESNPKKRMPQKAAPLSDEQVARIRAWIEQGAPWPEDLVLR